jgi:hypothetical protein
MRRLLHPTVALVTFLIGVSVASVWFIVRHQDFQMSEIRPVPVLTAPLFPQVSPEVEKYAVYSALIKDMYVEDEIELLVIGQETGCQTPSDNEQVEEMRLDMEKHAIESLPELERATIADFRVRTKECHSLSQQLDIPIKYVLVTERELERLFPANEFDRAWSRFYSKYPKSSGIINFSNVGFNGDMNQAFVSTGRGCGGLCGAGYFVLLVKEQGVWKVHSKVNTWVS